MKTWISILGAMFFLALTSCSVERMDRCKTTPAACPGLIGGAKVMTMTDLSPASGSITSIPSTVVATFSEGVADVEAAKFVITGTCAVLPIVSSVSMSADHTVATATLTGGSCLNAQTFSVTVTPASIVNLDGLTGSGSALVQTYTMVVVAPVGPVVTLSTPSYPKVRYGHTNVIQATFTGATASTLTAAGVTKIQTGTASCTLVVTAVSASGATLSLSSCIGDGTVSVSVNAGMASDGSGNLSAASAPSTAFIVDGISPSMLSLTPATSNVVAIPTTVVATFSEPMRALAPLNFAISGTCAVRPTVSGVTMNADKTVATATLTGGTCSEAQTIIVTVATSSLTDEIGNTTLGSAQVRTYTINTTGPVATLATPSALRINASRSSTIALTYNGAVATTLTNAGVTKNETGGLSCAVDVSGATAAGATLTISSCTGNGTITVRVNAGTATDSLGNANVISAASTAITVENTSPTLSSLTPTSGNKTSIPLTVSATFNEAMTALSAGNFTITGTCSILPTITSVTMSGGNTVANANLTASTCTVGQTVTVSVNPTAATDLAGNIGTGSVTAVTYTKINSPAVLTMGGTQNMGDTSVSSQYGDFDVFNNSVSDAEITSIAMNGPMRIASGGTCTVGQTIAALGGSCTIRVEALQNYFGPDTITVGYYNQVTNTTVTYSVLTEYNGLVPF
nr:hypothetical protein [uncultured organism]